MSIAPCFKHHLDDYIFEKPAQLVKLGMMLHAHTAGNNVEKMFKNSHKPFIDVGTTFNFKIFHFQAAYRSLHFPTYVHHFQSKTETCSWKIPWTGFPKVIDGLGSYI